METGGNENNKIISKTNKTSGRGRPWVCSGVRKNITYKKQTEKQKLKMATMAPK